MIGDDEYRRITKAANDYAYYDGYQHKHQADDNYYVRADQVKRPAGLDYDPTRFRVNYFKSFIKRKAHWQFGGKHGINVKPRQIDPTVDRLKTDYEASAEQLVENARAADYESLLTQVWRDNNMHEKLLTAAQDRLIAGRVACKIVFIPKTGRIKYVFHADTETFPIYSDDDADELVACNFIKPIKFGDDDNIDYLRKQSFVLDDETGECFISEGIYNGDAELVKEITPKTSMGLDFIPVVLFAVDRVKGITNEPMTELDDMREITDKLNALNEDAIDSLKFEMFPINVFSGATPGDIAKLEIAPGATIALKGDGNVSPTASKLESGFNYTNSLKETYNRLKGSLHDITNVPSIVPQDLNFGGINSDTLQIMFHDIIQDTQEHWLSWGAGLEELNEKTARYLQKRADAKTFKYNQEHVKGIGEHYDNEIKFVLPLPDNRSELVELLMAEVSNGFESQKGAVTRLGTENPLVKVNEIEAEQRRSSERNREATDPYNG